VGGLASGNQRLGVALRGERSLRRRITFDGLVEQVKVSTFTVVPSAGERAAVSRAPV